MKKLIPLVAAFMAVAAHAGAVNDNPYARYVHGLYAERAGDFATALSDYKKVVAIDPQALQVYKDIAQISMRTGRTEEGLRAAERVKELAPNEPASHLFLGDVYVARGDLAKAVQEFDKTLELDPRNLRALENLGNYYSAFNAKKALEYYERFLTIDPRDPEIHFQIGFLHQKNGEVRPAIAAFRDAIGIDADEIAPHLALAELYENEKSTNPAVEEYQECVRLDPHNPAFQARIGHLYFEDGKWDLAGQAFERARALEPHDASMYYWLARVAEEQRHWSEAEAHAAKAYKLSHDPQFLPLLSYYLTIEGKSQEAINWLEKARKVDSKNPNVLLFLGMDYLDLNKPEKALTILQSGIALDPKDAQLRFQLGIAYDRTGRFDQAVNEFETVIRLDPENAAAMNYLGYSYAEKGKNLEEAERLVRAALKLDSDNGAFQDSLGWIRYKRGDAKEAAQWLEQAVTNSQDALIYDHLGDVYMAAGNPEKAVGAWTKGLELSKTNLSLQKKIREASQHVVKGSDQRKYLKYIEGNYRQIADLRGVAVVHGTFMKQKFKTQGGLYYLNPDRLLLAIGAPGPAIRVSVRGQKVTIEPDAVAQAWRGMDLERLNWLPSFLSGNLLNSLDDASVTTSEEGTLLHYHGAHEEAWVDTERGVLTRFVRDNPQGGRDDLAVKSYALVDGVWLPQEMRIENHQEGWRATLNFSRWRVNEPQTAHAYETLMSSSNNLSPK